MLTPLQTDTAVTKAVGDEIGAIAATQKSTVSAFLDEVQAMQASLVGETGTATQTKATQLHEVGMMLMQHYDSISERVGQSTAGYIGADADGASSVASSGATAF
jgi:uncharacterized protein YukE